MSKPRDYRIEYNRRLERAIARGLSRSQARGHAKPGEALINPQKSKADTAVLEAALKSFHQTGSLGSAAKLHHISPDRLKRYLVNNSLARRDGRKWRITDTRPREMTVLSNGRSRKRLLPDFENASLNGRHLAAVKKFLIENDEEHLLPFVGRSVLDTKGNRHILETDPNILHIINLPGGGPYEQVYRLIF